MMAKLHASWLFWSGCILVSFGVATHIPMFLDAASMNYHMAGMRMSAMMVLGMALIPLGLALSSWGLLPSRGVPGSKVNPGFIIAEEGPLRRAHVQLVMALFVAITVDVMKPATLGFVMPGLSREYRIDSQASGLLPLVALTGTALGSVLWGFMADRLGRRAAILLSALMFIGTSICGAMPSFNSNLIMCFLMGMSAGGLLPITFTLMAETIPTRHRGWLLVALGGFGTAAGYFLAAGAAAWLEPLFSWRILWLLGMPTGLLIILLNRYIPESPRFLMSRGLDELARRTMARFGDPTPGEAGVATEGTEAAGGTGRSMGSGYGLITSGLSIAGISWGVVNFGFLLWLPTNLEALGYSQDVNTILTQSALLALPSVVLVIALYHYWSSIHTLVVFILANAASLLLVAAIVAADLDSNIAMSIGISLLLISASGVIATLLPYASEIYPLRFRGRGSGLIAASSKAGGILGAVFGVFGLFNDLVFSACVVAVPLVLAALLLLRVGIDTRGIFLEDISSLLSAR